MNETLFNVTLYLKSGGGNTQFFALSQQDVDNLMDAWDSREIHTMRTRKGEIHSVDTSAFAYLRTSIRPS